jgi:hypothetical protein
MNFAGKNQYVIHLRGILNQSALLSYYNFKMSKL